MSVIDVRTEHVPVEQGLVFRKAQLPAEEDS
jgi:hypothetical protein